MNRSITHLVKTATTPEQRILAALLVKAWQLHEQAEQVKDVVAAANLIAKLLKLLRIEDSATPQEWSGFERR
jgi:hypothetical protein